MFKSNNQPVGDSNKKLWMALATAQQSKWGKSWQQHKK